MNRIFGSGASKTPKHNLNDSISSNDTRIDSIEVKLRKLDAELAKYRDQLKRLREGPGKAAVQKRAMAVLKQKKLYEKQKEDLQAQNYNIESVQMTTDNLRNTMATVDAMKSANKEMKRQYGKLDINKIEVCCRLPRLLLQVLSFCSYCYYSRYITTWRISSSRPTKYKSPCPGRMVFPKKWMKPIWKQVSDWAHVPLLHYLTCRTVLQNSKH